MLANVAFYFDNDCIDNDIDKFIEAFQHITHKFSL